MWLHVPSTYLVCSQDTLETNWDSHRLSQLEQSVMWNEKHRSQRFWATISDREPSLKLLSGVTSAPLTQSRGVERWISSLPRPHANLIRKQEKGFREETNVSRPKRSSELQRNSEGQLSFWKTSPDTSSSGSRTPDLSYKEWDTNLRKQSLARKKLASHIREIGSLHSPVPRPSESEEASSTPPSSLQTGKSQDLWPTVTANPATYTNGFMGPNLIQRARNWPTVTAVDRPRSPETMAKSAAFRKKNANQNTVPLYLGEVARNWPTPSASEHKYRLSGDTQQSKGLETTSRKASLSIPQVQKTTMDGHTCSLKCLRLNHLFVSMLMGVHPMWLDLSGPLEMGSFLSWQHRHIEALRNL